MSVHVYTSALEKYCEYADLASLSYVSLALRYSKVNLIKHMQL